MNMILLIIQWKKKLNKIRMDIKDLCEWIIIGNNLHPFSINTKFKHLLQEEKNILYMKILFLLIWKVYFV